MNQRHLWKSLVIALPLLFAAGLSEASADDAALRREFADPPLRYQSRPLWFWNGKLDAEKTKAMVAACKAAGYYGMGILPSDGMGVDFMSPEFLKQYKVAVDAAGKLGMKMCLYDEYWFPSGSAGGLLAAKYPEALGKRLDMLATDVSGPKEFTQAVPEGTLMGAVAMEIGDQPAPRHHHFNQGWHLALEGACRRVEGDDLQLRARWRRRPGGLSGAEGGECLHHADLSGLS